MRGRRRSESRADRCGASSGDAPPGRHGRHVDDPDGAGYEGPPHHVTIRAFFLDAHETTNDDFIAFVAAKHVTRPERDGEPVATKRDVDFAAPRPSAASRRTLSGSSTWPATCGSGPRTCSTRTPTTTPRARSIRAGAAQGAGRVIRGGSWLWSPDRCIGYRVAARAKAVAAEGTNHEGLRCARSIP